MVLIHQTMAPRSKEPLNENRPSTGENPAERPILVYFTLNNAARSFKSFIIRVNSFVAADISSISLS